MSRKSVLLRKPLPDRLQNVAPLSSINTQNSSPDRQYGSTVVSDQAVALLGDVHGSFININIAPGESPSNHTVRLNQVVDSYTIETVHSFVTSGPLPQRGASSSVQKRWERREDLGAGVFGEVHREEHIDAQGYTSSRAM